MSFDIRKSLLTYSFDDSCVEKLNAANVCVRKMTRMTRMRIIGEYDYDTIGMPRKVFLGDLREMPIEC